MSRKEIIKKIILTAANNEGDDQEVAICAAQAGASSSMLISNLQMQILNRNCLQEDVYVGGYFEEVVPKYSETTYKQHFRMSRNCMEQLVSELSEVLSLERDIDKMYVPLEKKVHVTLWLLANHAISFRTTSDLFGLSKGTAHLIFLEICKTICQLKTKYIQWPTQNECANHAAMIEENTKFPGVVGMIDGCHIPIKAPSENAFDFYNRKQFYSVVLQGVCNAHLQFIDIYLGMTGKVHDARVFRVSPLSERISQGLLVSEHHLLGDSAYPLTTNLLTPYRDNGHLTIIQKKYNRVHAGIRSSIERTFGLLKNKFRRLQYLDMSLTNEITNVVATCCILHNFVLKHDVPEPNENYQEHNTTSVQYEWLQQLELNENRTAEVKRNQIASRL